MNPDEATADALDAFAQQVLGACAPLDHMPTARLVLKAKEPGAWFVVYFFGSDDARSKAIKGGDAYVVYKTFLDNIARVSAVEKATVHFEGAYEPAGDAWVLALRDACEARDRRWLEGAGEVRSGLCVQCGHDSNAHRLCGWKPSPEEPPRDGWMVCGDERCPCFATWSFNFKSPTGDRT
jgi:hypothetical protein